MHKHTGHIVISPRITEKGAYLSEKGAYVFNVTRDANKREIAEAIRTLYKVTPRRVNVVAVPAKGVLTRGTNRRGKTAAARKAYVYLNKGETIELM
jgi:large subunit ribosomal protein L23